MSSEEAKGAGIAVGSIAGLGLLIAAGYGIYNGNLGVLKNFLGPFAFALANFIPLGLITFGFIADTLGQEFRFSIPSIMAICAVILNKIIALMAEPYLVKATTGASSTGDMWCFVPGLEILESKLFPMNFIVMGSILTYYLIYALLNRNTSINISLIVAFLLFPAIQFIAFYLGGCMQYYALGAWGNIGSWLIGIGIGGATYAIVNALDPSKQPFIRANYSGPVPAAPSAYGSSNPVTTPQTGAKCSAADTNDDNAFVCEAYKNGVLVTEKIN
jgi:hypothetical protein